MSTLYKKDTPMKHFILLLLLPITISAFEVETPIPSGTIKQIELGSYLFELSGVQDFQKPTKPFDTPLDTINLGKYGNLYFVLANFVMIPEQEGVTMFLFHQPPMGQTLKVGSSEESWGCDTIGKIRSSVAQPKEPTRFDFQKGSWADTTKCPYFILWEYSHRLWDVEDPYEEILLWDDRAVVIKAEDGEWLKFRFTKKHFQYTTTESETGDFPYNKNFLGTTIPLRCTDDSQSGSKVELNAFDNEQSQSLIYLDKTWAFTIPSGNTSITSRQGEVWLINTDTSTGIYSFRNSYPVDTKMDWMDSLYHHAMRYSHNNDFGFGENNCISIDSLSRDSLWGINEKVFPEGRTKHEVPNYDTIAIALHDTVLTTLHELYSDTLNYYTLTNLFIGTDVYGTDVNYLQIKLMKDIPVANIIENNNSPNINLHKAEKVQLLSINGRVIKEFTSSYSKLRTSLHKSILPAGMYIVKTPHFTKKIRVK